MTSDTPKPTPEREALREALWTNAERARRIYGVLVGRLPIKELDADKTARVVAKDDLDKIFADAALHAPAETRREPPSDADRSLRMTVDLRLDTYDGVILRHHHSEFPVTTGAAFSALYRTLQTESAAETRRGTELAAAPSALGNSTVPGGPSGVPLPDTAETRREKSWLLCPHCLHRWNRNEFDVDAWAACPSCGGSFSYAKPREIAAPTPTPAPEPSTLGEHAAMLRGEWPTPEPPRAGHCTCWLGRPGATFGNSDERMACAVHGIFAAPPLPSSTAAAQEPKLPQFVSVVQREKGGVQIEGHTLKGDWELEIDANGDVVAFDGSDTIPRAELRRLRDEYQARADHYMIASQARIALLQVIADLDRLLAVEGAQPQKTEAGRERQG